MNVIRLAYAPPPDQGLEIVHRDEQLLAVVKPSGLLTVPGRGDEKADCLWSRVCARFPEARVVHRLDLGTSGLVLFALGLDNQRLISRLFEQRQIEKTYLARVAGCPRQREGTVDLPLICDWPNRPLQKVDHDIGKRAVTHFRLVCHDEASGTSLVRLSPVTGRSHQLRVHLQQLGHPILGDELYAPAAVYGAAPRLLLHATQLEFVHPLTGVLIRLTSPAPF